MISKRYFQILVILLGLWLIFDLVAHLGAEIFWFQEIGYLQVLLLRLQTQGLLWAIAFSITAVYLFGNLALAQRLLTRSEGREGQEEKNTTGQGLSLIHI